MNSVNTPASNFCEVDGAKIHYHQMGQGAPLLMIHGGAPGAFGWGNFKANCEELQKKFCVIVVDLPGYGKSEILNDKADTIFGCAGIFNDFMHNLGYTSYNVIGMATGGCIAAELAINYPDKIQKIVLVSAPVGYAKYQSKNKKAASQILVESKEQSIENMRSYLEKLLYNKALLTEELVLERYNESLTSQNMKKGKKQKNNDLWKHIDKIRCETLIMWGRENHAHSYENAVFTHAQIEKSQLHIFSQCGLWVPFEKKNEFNQLVINFI